MATWLSRDMPIMKKVYGSNRAYHEDGALIESSVPITKMALWLSGACLSRRWYMGRIVPITKMAIWLSQAVPITKIAYGSNSAYHEDGNLIELNHAYHEYDDLI